MKEEDGEKGKGPITLSSLLPPKP